MKRERGNELQRYNFERTVFDRAKHDCSTCFLSRRFSDLNADAQSGRCSLSELASTLVTEANFGEDAKTLALVGQLEGIPEIANRSTLI